MWVGLDLCDRLGWVEFFLIYHGGLGQKIPWTRPMYTPSQNIGHNLPMWWVVVGGGVSKLRNKNQFQFILFYFIESTSISL